jgi:PBP1b-binding outer membrane lipoprotein LpoB
MNSSNPRALVNRLTAAALLAGAALLLGACSTAPAAQVPLEKTVTYKELHSLMVKLAHEPAQRGTALPEAKLAMLSGDLGGSSILAANP